MESENTRIKFWLIVGFSYLLLLGTSFLLKGHSSIFWGMKWDWSLSLILTIALYTIVSIKIVGLKEKGARSFLGMIIDILEPGPVFVPIGFCDLEKETRLNIQSELPDDPENIFRGDGPVPEGKFPPIRITFGPPSENSEGISDDDSLNVRMTQEVVLVITWRIKDFFQFLTTIGSVEEAERQMEDMSIAMLMESFTKITPAVALKNLPEYSEKLKKAIDNKVDTDDENSWGIDLIEAKIKMINFSHKLNEAIQGVPEAELNKKSAVITAEGEGASEKAILEGRTAGLKHMAEKLNVSGSEVLGAETARGITNNPGQKTIIAGAEGFGNLVATAGTIMEAVKPTQKPDSKENKVKEETSDAT